MIKYMICFKENISPNNQRLVFEGQQLEDYAKLKSYNIENESIIHFILRYRGYN